MLNKETLKKFKNEFDWWLNGGSVLAAFNDKGIVDGFWRKVTPNWMGNTVYVINDEYVELRKAIAEGREVEQYEEASDTWFDYDLNEHKDFNSGYKYRVKHIMKYKIGDWVYSDKNKNIQRLQYEQQVEQINEDPDTHKWAPSKGELCVFWYADEPNHYVIDKYSGSDTVTGLYCTIQGESYTEVAPCIIDMDIYK